MREWARLLALRLLPTLVLLVIWEWAGNLSKTNQLFLSSPSAIIRAAAQEFAAGEIWNDLYVSGSEFVLGFSLAVVMGLPVGFAMGWYGSANQMLRPFVSAMNATPRVSLVPLLIIWFGIGLWSKVALVFLGALFPLIINMELGIRTLDESQLRVARSFNANDWQIFRTIALPGSVPFLLAGMRIACGRALVGIVVGELVAATAGIGYYMAIAGATFQTDKLFVGLALITGFGVFLTELLEHLERRFELWRPRRP